MDFLNGKVVDLARRHNLFTSGAGATIEVKA
jgi:hypothetical protein